MLKPLTKTLCDSKYNLNNKEFKNNVLKPIVNFIAIDYNNIINSLKNMRIINNLNDIDGIVKQFIILKDSLYKEDISNIFKVYRGVPVDSPSKARMKQATISSQLSKLGFSCIPIRGSKYNNNNGVINNKANVDNIIAADLIKCLGSLGKGSSISILSGDADFLYMGEVLRAYGFKVSIISGGGIVSGKIKESRLFTPLHIILNQT